MKLNKRYIGLFLFLAAALIAMYGAYGFITNRQSSTGPSIGVVQIDDVLEFNPSYEDYKNAKTELEQLKSQYALEQEALNTKSDLQNEQLKSLSLDTTLSDALNVELQTRIATKQNQLNAQLDAKRAELVKKYMEELKVANKGYDLEIVNLQLQLYAFDSRVYIDDAQKEAAQAEKAELESRLESLLAKRKPSNFDMDAIRAKVDAELKPIRDAGEQELKQYAESVQAELAKKRDTMMQNQAKAIVSTNNLPVPQEWNDSWAKKLSDKEAEVNALHEAILEDVRMRVAIIAQERHLDLVLIDHGGNIKGLDITDAVKASYRVQ
ncbi:MAG: hypothetical protein E7F02_00240 [Veillonella sp.]|uniref:hypothetical protein n=1 Tax=Veillonella sp. TaxID=1926307 RepID=UPI002902508A|nr:hypothetical protein [Veillonella sp.]MDU2067265.1 hypothetical protein [Veillonella sp.]MDU3280825.1 hypothetical protein [Veillonella sp.]